jgi:tetratricopeptide (TPR) repeat protein
VLGVVGAGLVAREGVREAARILAEPCEVADDVASAEVSREARTALAVVRIHTGDLDGAREVAEAARKIDIPLRNAVTAAVLGVAALRQGDDDAAREAFGAALAGADELIALNPSAYEALDTKGLALAGLALCGEADRLAAARAAYDAARGVTTDPGIIRNAIRLLDALAVCDRGGVLAEVRPVAAGEASA